MNSRIGSIGLADPSRAEFNHSTTEKEIKKLVKNTQLKVLQCSKPVKDRTWIMLNEHFFSARPDVELRIYGHYSDECDLSICRFMTNVRHFSADCLRSAKNVEAIAEIPKIKSLSIDIYDLKDFHLLELVPSTLTSLSLGATRSKKPTLKPLERFRSLKVLYIEGNSKDIEVLDALRNIEDLTLRSITTPNLEYLASLEKLWSLDIKLGGIRSFSGIEGKESIK